MSQNVIEAYINKTKSEIMDLQQTRVNIATADKELVLQYNNRWLTTLVDKKENNDKKKLTSCVANTHPKIMSLSKEKVFTVISIPIAIRYQPTAKPTIERVLTMVVF